MSKAKICDFGSIWWKCCPQFTYYGCGWVVFQFYSGDPKSIFQGFWCNMGAGTFHTCVDCIVFSGWLTTIWLPQGRKLLGVITWVKWGCRGVRQLKAFGNAAIPQDLQQLFLFVIITGAKLFEGPGCYYFISLWGAQVVLSRGSKFSWKMYENVRAWV